MKALKAKPYDNLDFSQNYFQRKMTNPTVLYTK